jgi:hypothetical protein
MSAALSDLLEELKSDPRVAAAVASDPVMAAHLEAVIILFDKLRHADGHAVELHDEAVRIVRRPELPLGVRVQAMAEYLFTVPKYKLAAIGIADVPPTAETGRLQ